MCYYQPRLRCKFLQDLNYFIPMSMMWRETDSDVSLCFPYVYGTEHDSLDETVHREVFSLCILEQLMFHVIVWKIH